MTATVIAARVPRPYQHQAHDAVIAKWAADQRRTAVVLPTGAGKSTVIAMLAHTCVRLGLRPLIVAHRAELLDQIAENCAAVDPAAAPVGIVRADLDDPHAPIVAASLQTLTRPGRLDPLRDRTVVLFDEVHHATADTYLNVLNQLGVDDGAFFCGFTATLRRNDGKALRGVIDSVAFERDLRWAMAPENGYLVKPRGLTVHIPALDLQRVRVRAGDFANNDLAEVMETTTPEIAKVVLTHCRDRRPIIFAASVQAAHDIADTLTRAGLEAEAVTGALNYGERQPIYDRYRAGTTRALVTVMVLTEGADFPMCDCAVIARPTMSQILYSQMVGRALRLHPGKTDALVLDLVGTTRVLKLVTLTDLDTGAVVEHVDPDGEPVAEDDLAAPVPAPSARKVRLQITDMVDIDLLGSAHTDTVWLTTYGGTPFTRVRDIDRYVFLWESGYDESGPLYKVGHMDTRSGTADGEWVEDRSWPVEVARDIAEDWIIDSGGEASRRTAPWRVKNQPPTDGQLALARKFRVPDAEQMTRGRLSDEIDIRAMSNRLDRYRAPRSTR